MLDLTRLPDWSRRLIVVTSRHARLPAFWGVNDCLLATMEAVEAVTGVDPCADIRSKYDSEIAAAKLLLRRGYRDVEEAFEANFPETSLLGARRGDIGIAIIRDRPTSGWITENGFTSKSETGLIFQPQTAIKRAFKVG